MLTKTADSSDSVFCGMLRPQLQLPLGVINNRVLQVSHRLDFEHKCRRMSPTDPAAQRLQQRLAVYSFG